jgi:hypothetical protein
MFTSAAAATATQKEHAAQQRNLGDGSAKSAGFHP